MPDPHQHWLRKLVSLNPNSSKTKGKAPHKPLLLLCLIDLAEAGALAAPRLCKTPELRLRFDSYWHWMFDEHLWSVDDKLRVVVAREIFTEWGPEAYWLKRRHGQPLHFMEGVDLRPSRDNVARHYREFVRSEG